MSMISCGGFEVGEGLSINNGVLSASGGGATVVTFTYSSGTITATHTPSQVDEALKTGVVIGKLVIGTNESGIGVCTVSMDDSMNRILSFMPCVVDDIVTGFIHTDNDEWVVGFSS